MKIKTGILTLSVLAVIPLLVFGNPIRTLASRFEDWRSPCAGPEASQVALPDFLQSITPTVQPLPQILRELVNQMKETKEKIEELKHNYTQVRIHQGDCENNLDAAYLRLDGFPTTPSFKGAMRMFEERNLTDILLKDYHKLSVVMIFLEQVRWDEDVYENDQFLPILNNIFRSLKSILCVLTNALTSQSAQVTEFANRTHSMGQRYRTMSRAENHDRDYIIMRQSLKLFSNMILKYVALKDFLEDPNSAL
ncbi:uncharacterized protein LOC133181430 [Saccostrea echinata]|uniref:uncharacterized protein LOC133181430 n=1 Tax=Saccostrea echinata TaxID=191078 RepID=UPI002A83299D|nr:uncharacterized protein LOC133181430 [Saccostrea echinata]